METQNCFLLSYVRYGDNDAILHCFGKESGFFSVFARGIYAAKNKKKAYLFPLNQINITFAPSQKQSNLGKLFKIERIRVDYDFDNVKINSILFFISDFLYQILKKETFHAIIYYEIERFLAELYAENFNSYFAFIFKILAVQGISPLYENQTYLNPETGNFEVEKSHVFFDEELSTVWKNYLINENTYRIVLKRVLRKNLVQSLMIYYRIHFSGFFEPKSLEIVQQIYE